MAKTAQEQERLEHPRDDESPILQHLRLSGFCSIAELDLELSRMNVMIGANGAGKSNLIHFFRMLSWMVPWPGGLQKFIAKNGGANSLLHLGAEHTGQLRAALSFKAPKGLNEYRFLLGHGAPDRLYFEEEEYRFFRNDLDEAEWTRLGSGQVEANLIDRAAVNRTAEVVHSFLKGCKVYQFHNTSETARIRQSSPVDDNVFLREDGANLASVLLRLEHGQPACYRRIVRTFRLMAPTFERFVLEPRDGHVMLRWRERFSDYLFGPHQASDGTLRTMALVALLLQPPDALPNLLVLDEPELGLHPYAIEIVAGLIQAVAVERQVLLATQSSALVDYFEPESILVVDRDGPRSTFQRLDSSTLKEWLENYSTGELWEKNVFGGQP